MTFWYYIYILIAFMAGATLGLMFGCMFRLSGDVDKDCRECPKERFFNYSLNHCKPGDNLCVWMSDYNKRRNVKEVQG